MPRRISQLLLAMLLRPIGAMFYISVYVYLSETLFNGNMSQRQASVAAGVVTWAFAAVYWFFVWRSSVPWDARRLRGTGVATAVALAAAVVLGGMGCVVDEDFGVAVGSITAPLAWLPATVVAWRETDVERKRRRGSVGTDEVVCPKCGYSLTGLTESRCPECGTQYTLSELLAAQPGREVNELL
jgi:hypothetical protein